MSFFQSVLSYVPVRYRYRIGEAKNAIWGGYARKYYSQFGEDVALKNIFAHTDTGFYVDVGAHHPKRYSNTYLLFKRGWRGINIDANPHTIDLFNASRPGDINIHTGVGATRSRTLYYLFSDPAMNTFDASEAKRAASLSWLASEGTIPVDIVPLADILSGISGLPQIDLLTIDVEGMDLEVLQSNDWSRYTPRVVVVETGEFDPRHPLQSPVYAFLSEKGYILVSRAGKSLIFTSTL